MPRTKTILSFGGERATFVGNKTITGSLTVTGQILAADGTASLPGYGFSAASGIGMYRVGSNILGLAVGSGVRVAIKTTGLHLASGGSLAWSDSGGIAGDVYDLFLTRDAANTANQRNGTNAQTQRITETYTDINNRAGISLSAAAGGPYVITPEAVGSGVLRGLQICATSGLVGFMGATPVVRQVSAANLTNNVTSGGTDDTIADFVSLTVYATDAAAIRNDIYQLARKLKQVNDALRLYGLLT